MHSIVAIDIETTGLDENRDSIIEIAAVKFKGSRIEEEWSSLINPNRHIPEFITGLTGIDDAMVRQSPHFREVSRALEVFVGDAPIVGHSIRFDLGFLQKQIPFSENDVIDTYELAAVLLPNASRYNLGSLGKELGILLPATHRAMDDARVTMAALNRLLDMAGELPVDLVAELLRLSEPLTWGASYVFEEVMRSRLKEGIQPRKDQQRKSQLSDNHRNPPLENPENPLPLDLEEVASILEYGGPFSQYFEAYEHRPEQVEMLKAVTNALSNGKHLLVEAGTGVGKSVAYLIPAALFAIRNNTALLSRPTRSTYRINLSKRIFLIFVLL